MCAQPAGRCSPMRTLTLLSMEPLTPGCVNAVEGPLALSWMGTGLAAFQIPPFGQDTGTVAGFC